MIKPTIRRIRNIDFSPYEKIVFPNSQELFVISGGTAPVFKLEICFPAGRWYEEQQGTASATLAMIGESINELKGTSLTEDLEYFGAQVGQECGADFASIQVMALTRQAQNVLPLFAGMIQDAEFTEEELDDYKKLCVEDLTLQARSNTYLAEQAILDLCVGSGHPYGGDSPADEILGICLEDVESFYQSRYLGRKSILLLSGAVDDSLIAQVEDHFGKHTVSRKPEDPVTRRAFTYEAGRRAIEGAQEAQAGLYMGCPAVSRNHEDFRTLFLLTTLLGGYFGSRLMRNIREQKGMTYHIGSSLDAYRHGGIFTIFTELNAGSVASCLKEINNELDKIRTQEVGSTELDMVRNYLMGNLLSQSDGPFASMEYLKQILLETGEEINREEDVDRYLSIGPRELLACANRYLAEDNLSVAIASRGAITH